MRSTYKAGEFIAGEVASWAGVQPRGVVFCHGAGDLAVDPFRDQHPLIKDLAQYATVHVGDLGGDTWANDTGIAAVGAAVARLRSQWGSSGPVVLVGMSMGHAVACAYALAHPENVAGIAGVIPLVDIRDAMRFDPTSINAAYGGAFDEAVDGPLHNPAQMSLDPAIPHALWCTGADPFTPIEIAQAYAAAHPEVELNDVGAWGHTDAAVTVSTPAIVDWVADVYATA